MISLTNPYVLLGGVCGAALLLAAGFGLGHHQKTLEDASAALAAAQKAVTVVAKQGAVNSAVDQKSAATQAKIASDTVNLLQRVPIYVTRKSDDQCIVGRGAVQLLDAAASGSVPSAPSGLPDADSGVALSSIVADNAINAGSYRQLAERLNTWDAWYDAQKALAASK